jgi:hypothetical protein
MMFSRSDGSSGVCLQWRRMWPFILAQPELDSIGYRSSGWHFGANSIRCPHFDALKMRSIHEDWPLKEVKPVNVRVRKPKQLTCRAG